MNDSAAIEWVQWLLDSYARWLGNELIERVGHPQEQAASLFCAPFVVVSHGKESDPLLNYGNQMALDLWEMRWEELVGSPSRLTAEPVNRAERDRMLRRVAAQGYITDYSGIRISKTGRRFLVDQATVWTILDNCGCGCGQAATFSSWTYLDGRS